MDVNERNILPGDFEADEVSFVDRRSFLKLAGFTFAGMALAGCEQTRIEKAIPYLIKPEEITPGKAYWYASTCGGCSAGCGILVKNRDGRPIKVEGNSAHPVSKGGLCVVGQAMVLGVYDSKRLSGPIKEGSMSDWPSIDRFVRSRLEEIKAKRGKVRVLTGTVNSPTTTAVLQRFLRQFNDARHIVYDPLSQSAILDAHAQTHDARVLPRYRFEKAEVIVSFDADFLGTWISPVEFTRGYRAGRTLQGDPPRCSYHVQFESRYSLTGSKADDRITASPAEMFAHLARLASALQQKAGPGASAMSPTPLLQKLADRLWEARGRSLVVCGTNDLNHQLLVNHINHFLDNYGATVDIKESSHQHGSNDTALLSLLKELENGEVSALLIAGLNPVYDLPGANRLAGQLSRVPLVVSFADRIDETAAHAHAVCPDHHPLESWSDAEPVAGILSITQPAVAPLGNTRAVIESFSAWSGNPKSALDLIKEEWKRSVFPRHKGGKNFQAFWDRSVHDGFALLSPETQPVSRFNRNLRPSHSIPPLEGFTLVLYPKVSMLDGRHAHNAWLHEVPDPMTKIAWDNYAMFSPAAAEKSGIKSGDVVRIIVREGVSLELPAWVQPGQHDAVVAVAIGYGRKGTDRFTRIGPKWLEGRPSVGPDGLVGVRAAELLGIENGLIRYQSINVRVEKTSRVYPLACTQTYHSIDAPALAASEKPHRRPFIQETSLTDYKQNPSSGSFPKPESRSMWPEQHQYTGHHWGMVIDLNACTGCAACVVSCQAENNIPVVGKDEVLRNREMHWIRIDRYFMENGDRTDVAHQPMLCHHCDNAPCETVCPVQATVHSAEGLNQQVYNRCVGTRYCANNCPYKIRRFNWFDYPRENQKENMVLNPDVTVRSRGIMEKCSFCTQRIQEVKIEARRTGQPVRESSLQAACQQSCPAQAIVFGDMNDPDSSIAGLLKDPRQYRILSELETRPSVSYMTVVRNRQNGKGGEDHG